MGKKVMEQIFSDAINHHHFNGTVATALGQQIQDYLIAAIQNMRIRPGYNSSSLDERIRDTQLLRAF
jgi:hypothetical protein